MIKRKSTGFYNRECHIIGIGIDKYKYKEWIELDNCKSDVERFISKVCGNFETFSREFVTELYNENATNELIGITIRNKIRMMNSHQNLIIYFAGHGTHSDKLGYLAPYDAKSSYANPNKSKLIPHTEIFNWIDDKSPWHIVIILDCCRGGKIMHAKRASVEKNITLDEIINNTLGSPDYERMKETKPSLPPDPPPPPTGESPKPLDPTGGADEIKVDISKPKPIKPNKNWPLKTRKVYFDEDKENRDSVNVVFVGSFQIKGNAEALLEKLKQIGYQKAEIVMKENLPYAVVVTGFHQSNITAKMEVKKLKKKGIEVYYSESDYFKIYRK